MHLEERIYTHIYTYIYTYIYGREATSLSSKTKSHSVDFGTVEPHSGVGRGRSIHGISINRVTEEKLQFGCSSIQEEGRGVKGGQLEVFIRVTGESSCLSTLLFNPRIACHSFLTESFFPFPFFLFSFPIDTLASNLSHLSLTTSLSLFFPYISCNVINCLSLSLVVFDDIRSSLFYNVSSLSIVSFTRIHTRSFHSPFSLYSGHSKTNCHSIRPLFEA